MTKKIKKTKTIDSESRLEPLADRTEELELDRTIPNVIDNDATTKVTLDPSEVQSQSEKEQRGKGQCKEGELPT